ncbi:MAG: hypothetical protein ABIA77_06355, partial [Candidatus Omnitrophota bacterium]
YPIDGVPVQVSENIPNMVDFYEIAMKRDEALIDNTLKRMEAEGTDRCVLIAGGFHTKGMKYLLEKKGVSYVVVTPKITKDVETPYIKVLTNQRTSLEDILTESALPGTPKRESEDSDTGFLSPVLRIGMAANLVLSRDPESRAIFAAWARGMDEVKVPGAEDLRKVAEDTVNAAIDMAVGLWIQNVIKKGLETQYEAEPAKADKIWTGFVTDDNQWSLLQSVYLGKVRTALRTMGAEDEFDALNGIIVDEFARIRDKEQAKLGGGTAAVDGTPGSQAAGEVLSYEQARKFDKVLRDSFETGRAHIVERDDIRKGFRFVKHDGLIEALEEMGLPVNVHPGRGGDALSHQGLQAHIDSYIYDALSVTDEGRKMLDTLAAHELAHLDLFNAEQIERLVADQMKGEDIVRIDRMINRQIKDSLGSSGLVLWAQWKTYIAEKKPEELFDRYLQNNLSPEEEIEIANLQENFINRELKHDTTPVVAEIEELIAQEKEKEQAQIKQDLIDSSTAMAEAAAKNIGPDIIIVTSSTAAQTAFWQDRLTGDNGINGSGAVVKENGIVISVSESNWDGGAGNGLGTLNGYVQAARQLKVWAGTLSDSEVARLGIGTFKSLPDQAKDQAEKESEIVKYIDAFMSYSKNKSVFMYHTAGKGTRTAPLPGAEVNSNPNMALPKMVDVKGQPKQLTILEAVLMQTSIYAPTRENRLSVFWGDQVIVNQNDVKKDPTHHVEIFGQLVPLDENIKDYGVLIPKENGDAKQREKFTEEQVREELPEGMNDVYKSIGSFTVSN